VKPLNWAEVEVATMNFQNLGVHFQACNRDERSFFRDSVFILQSTPLDC